MLLALALISLVAVVLVLAFVPSPIVRQQIKGQIPVSVNYFFLHASVTSHVSCSYVHLERFKLLS